MSEPDYNYSEFERQFPNCSNHYMFLIDPDHSHLYWSDNARNDFYLPAEDSDLSGLAKFVHPDDCPAFFRLLEERPPKWERKFRFRKKTGQYSLHRVIGSTVQSAGSVLLSGVICTNPLHLCERSESRLIPYLHDSVQNGFQGFELVYQPIVYSDTGRLYGSEALLRWEHPDFPDSPEASDIVHALETGGLIREVGQWIIRTACSQCANWNRIIPDFQMSVNVSYSQFEDPEFLHIVMNTLAEFHLDPSLLTLELTESREIRDIRTISQSFDFLRSQGIKTAFDDFGTGYDSLNVFRILSADELKIDRSFLERLTYNVADQMLVKQIIDFCHSINMLVCVEGVETGETEQIIRQLGAGLCQGYYYDKPLKKEAFQSAYLSDRSLIPSVLTDGDPAPEFRQSLVYDKVHPVQTLCLESLIDQVHAGIFQVGMDYEFTFLTCNEGYRRMLGYTPKEIDEKFRNRALGFVHPDDMDYVNQEIRRQLGAGDTVTIEFRVVRSDGKPLWILGTGNVVKDPHGISSLVVVILDNDRFKKRELKLEQDIQKWRKILTHVPVGIKCVRYDEDFTLEYISPPFLSVLGYSEQEVREQFDGKYLNMIWEEDRQRVINDILSQVKQSHVVHLRYRSYCKSGEPLWLETVSQLCKPDADGIERCYSSVVAVTDSLPEDENSSALSLANRYQAAVKWWGDVLFECSLIMDTISFSENYVAMFDRKPQSSIRKELAYLSLADRKKVIYTLRCIRNGKHPTPVEIQVRKDGGKKIWCSLIFNTPDCIGGKPVSVIGKITNINAEKEKHEKLLKQSMSDSMTGLLNKMALETQIRKRLETVTSDRCFALFMIDIDYFKSVNDNYGHVFGDALLMETARRLRSLFRAEDIIGRAGGDEFMAFIEYDGNIKSLRKKGSELLGKLTAGFTYMGQYLSCGFSIGIARYPCDGIQFYDLFRRADSAMYNVKYKGKNNYQIFSDTIKTSKMNKEEEKNDPCKPGYQNHDLY